jgi:hypothetical protein
MIFQLINSAILARKTIVGDFNLDGKPDIVRPQVDMTGWRAHITLAQMIITD